ncbi:MAG TPA: sulfotransferase domain-containing protein [Terriglobales bacterium]|nr:sulfotransferase domain-containing protein [Terriglobales bacterium]
MFSRLIGGSKMLLGLHKPRRSLKIWPDDIFLVSFPKSGNTWTRFLIANLVFPDAPVGFKNIHKLVPDPYGTSKRDMERMARPRIIKSHECFEPRYPRVMYIVRDPRDVVISQYHYHRKCKKIEDGYPMEKFVDRFVAGDTCPHGSWGENVGTWLTARHNDPRFLLLKYEDMVADTQRELGRVAAFVGIKADSERIAKAVERSSADRMRKLERAQADECGLTKDSRKDLSFVRAAKSGSWQKDLSEPLVAKIEDAWPQLMVFLGYKLVTRGTAGQPAEFSSLVSSGV